MNYLYSTGFLRELSRHSILRETKTQYVLESGVRARKSNLRQVGGSRYFIYPTPELDREYKLQHTWRAFLRKLDHISENRNHYKKNDLGEHQLDTILELISRLENELKGLL